MKKKKCHERGRIILYENGSLPDDDFDAPGGGNIQEPDDDVDCTLSFDERGSVAGLSDDIDIDMSHTEMLEGETQSSHFDPPPEELEELQSEHFNSRATDTDNDTVDTPNDADATTESFNLSDENRCILETVIDVITVADCPVSVDTLIACKSLGVVGGTALGVALGEGVACGLLNVSSNNKYAVDNCVRKRVSRLSIHLYACHYLLTCIAMSLFSSSHIQNSSACILYVRISAYQSVAREVSLRALRVQSMFVIGASPLGTGNVNIVRPTVMPNLIPVMMTTRMMPLPTILNKLHRLTRRLVSK